MCYRVIFNKLLREFLLLKYFPLLDIFLPSEFSLKFFIAPLFSRIVLWSSLLKALNVHVTIQLGFGIPALCTRTAHCGRSYQYVCQSFCVSAYFSSFSTYGLSKNLYFGSQIPKMEKMYVVLLTQNGNCRLRRT